MQTTATLSAGPCHQLTPFCCFSPLHRPFSVVLFCHFQFWLFDVCSGLCRCVPSIAIPSSTIRLRASPIPQVRKSGVLHTTDSQRVFSIGRRIEKKRYKSHDQYSSLHISTYENNPTPNLLPEAANHKTPSHFAPWSSVRLTAFPPTTYTMGLFDKLQSSAFLFPSQRPLGPRKCQNT